MLRYSPSSPNVLCISCFAPCSTGNYCMPTWEFVPLQMLWKIVLKTAFLSVIWLWYRITRTLSDLSVPLHTGRDWVETVTHAAPVKAAGPSLAQQSWSDGQICPLNQRPRVMTALYHSATHSHNWGCNFALEHRDTGSLWHFQAYRHTNKTTPTYRNAPTRS